jgi:beta-glucosidase
MDIKATIAKMTLEEKASLCSGANSWDTEKVDRVGLPKVTMSDGPHGLRRQLNYEDKRLSETNSSAERLGQSGGVVTREAIGWPTASALAASFDRNLLTELGELLGDECLAYDTQILLGPGVNIKRSPLCGRNFEYFSEDPYVAGELSAAYIKAIQSKGVSACVKHFAANNQEKRRMSADSIVSTRALREIYLPAFEAAVKKGGVKSVMCSYNLINGVYSCENTWLLTEVLRDEWGFDGIVMTDWGAMNDRVEALKAGLELEMPSSGGINDKKIVEAVKSGELDEAVLDNAVERLLKWIDWCLENKKAVGVSLEEHHKKAGDIAAKCAVLLKNDGNLLPISPDKKIVFIGGYAKKPRMQGGGSSHIKNYKIDSALEAVKDYANVEFIEMFHDDESNGDEEWQKAIEAAKNADVAVIFAGLPDSFESEGFDRTHLDMPEVQKKAITEIGAVQENTVVMLHAGSPIIMPWIDSAKSVLNLYLSGEGVGTAAVKLLFGEANPAGKLAETYPLRFEDTPSYLTYGKSKTEARYDEGIFVGYRWYDGRNMEVLFPFGYGLSYTTFEMKNLKLSSDTIKPGEKITATVDVTNTGDRAGAEVVQVYVGFDGEDTVCRPVRELRGFEKV